MLNTHVNLIFVLILVITITVSNAYSFIPLTPGTIIIQQTTTTGKQGTYNTTLANNIIKNSAGYKLNFINGTNNPISLVNDPTRSQINITLTDTTGAGGGVSSLNALTGALTIACVSGNTTCTTSGGNTITINTAWNIVTTGGSAQTVTKALTVNSLILGGQMDLNSNTLKSSGHMYTFPSNTGTVLLTNGSGASLTGITVSSLNNAGHISTAPPNTGTILDTNGSLSSLIGTLQSTIGVTTLSNAGHVSTFPLNTGTLLQTNGSGAYLTQNVHAITANSPITVNGSTNTVTISCSTCITSSGVTSVTGTTNQITASPTTGAVILSIPTIFDLAGITEKVDSSGFVIRNPAKTFATTLSGNAVTANQTLNLPLIGSTDTLDALNTAATWTGNHQFTITSALFENNAKTFATTLSGGSVTANRTLNLPTILGTDTLGSLGMTQTWTGNNTMKFGAGGVIIRNPASTFATKLEGAPITANRTLNLPTITGTDTLAALGTAQGWLANQDFGINSNTDTFDSQGIIIRNPAHTFATTLVNSAIVANRTLNLPLTIQTETIATKPVANFTASSNKTGTATFTMVGDGVTLTPTVTGRASVSVSGYATTSVAADGGAVQIRQITGGCPANAAAPTGTALGSNVKMTGPATTSRIPFSITVQTTGLTINQKYCFELTQQAITGGTFTVFNLMWAAEEV